MFMAKDDCGSIQMLTDVSIDPAGTIWAANNWNALDGMAGLNLGRRIGLHGHLWRGVTGEAAAHGHRPKPLTNPRPCDDIIFSSFRGQPNTAAKKR